MNVFVILIILHLVDGGQVVVNVEEITSLRQSKEEGSKHFTEKAKCLINLADGKFVTVIETCEEVRKQIEGDLR
jgi:hypothetical protein